MGITVRDLTLAPHLGTRIHAGTGGLDRSIRLAHACEMPAPWEWLSEDDLLLTSGMGLPRSAPEQADYVRRLAGAGLAGIDIGENHDMPSISPEMERAAERLRFPILVTAYEVPWGAVVRAVIDANASEAHLRLATTARIYDHARDAVADGRSGEHLLAILGIELGCELAVLPHHPRRGPVGGGSHLPVDLSDALCQAVAERRGRLPAFLPLREGDVTAVAVPLPVAHPCSLVALPGPDASLPDVALLRHAATVVALDVEHEAAAHTERMRQGAALLTELLELPMDPTAARWRLAEHGVVAEALVIAAWGPPDQVDADRLHGALEVAGVEHLLVRRDDCVVTLSVDPGDALPDVMGLIGPGAQVGVSDSFAAPSHARDAMRQGLWAMHSAAAGGARCVRYGARQGPFFPATLSEAHGAVDRVLGPLLIRDRDHHSALVHTLRVFLESNRSWKRASEALFIHKQTLVYRIRHIERLTGRRLDNTHDVAELWFALRTLELEARASA
jgi:purine catabolism regulator